jgi:hypothetical protein
MADDIDRNEVVSLPAWSGVRVSELVKRISWGAVWAGAIVTLGMEALFTAFGLFIGFGMYDSRAANPWAGISAWTTVWYLVTAGWSMFFGAWCAGRLSGDPVRGSRILHGITSWGLATIATVAIVTIASWSVLSQGVDLLRTAAAAGAQVAPGQVSQAVQQAGQTAAQLQSGGPLAQATANIVSGIALRIWGGVLLGFITALFGGWLGRGLPAVVTPTQFAAGPSTRAA